MKSRANDTDKKRNQMNILVSEIIEEKSIRDKITEDLEKKRSRNIKSSFRW